MKSRNFLPAATLLLATSLHASHITHFGTLDNIDHIFPSLGGNFTGSLSSSADDAWLGFSATAGDVVTAQFSSTGHTFAGAIFRDEAGGSINVGDVANVGNFNINQAGAGTDLIVQHGGWNPYSYYYFFSTPWTLTFSVPASGEYVIGVASDNSQVPSGTFTVALTGNNAPALPEVSSTLALLALGTAGISLARRKL